MAFSGRPCKFVEGAFSKQQRFNGWRSLLRTIIRHHAGHFCTGDGITHLALDLGTNSVRQPGCGQISVPATILVRAFDSPRWLGRNMHGTGLAW